MPAAVARTQSYRLSLMSMTLAASILFALLVTLALAHYVMSARFEAAAGRLSDRLTSGPQTGEADVPEAIRAFAQGNGGGENGPVRAAVLTQDAEIQRAPDGPFEALWATQTLGLGASGFVWLAETPDRMVPTIRVLDAFVGGAGMLRVRLFGSIPVASAGGADLDKGEAMRYLAELPWAPDAILGNPEIIWTELADGWIEAALTSPPAAVQFRLAYGDIVEMRAENRPAQTPDGRIEYREWQARFESYDMVGDRRIPTEAEIGYVIDGVYAPYFRAWITSYSLID